MGMNEQQITDLKRLMEYEAARTEPPAGFPHLPDLPAGRYTDERFYQLEKEHLWRKSWLFAAHIDEIPDPGCYMLWENAGQPVIIVHGDDGEIDLVVHARHVRVLVPYKSKTENPRRGLDRVHAQDCRVDRAKRRLCQLAQARTWACRLPIWHAHAGP